MRRKAIQSLKASLEAIENKLPADKMNQLRQEMADVKFQMDYYDSQLRNVQADLQGKTMERTYQDVGIQEYENRIEETLKSNEELASEKPKHQEEITLTQQQITELEAQTLALDETLKQLQEERDAVQNQLIEEEKQKSLFERQLTQLHEQLHAFQARQKELEAEVREATERLAQSGFDLDGLDEQTLPSEEELKQSIQKLEKRMQAMEPVNMLAIEEFDEVSKRQAELSDKINTLNREREAITVKISSYEELKRTSFGKSFESVDNNFKKIFEELADGEARLVLTNPDSPFEGGMSIEARPRGKKMQRIESMSGGEKSLTSLAFVFSLQQYMPAPFYALDEVDMNLDGINVEKLANMVKREATRAQFIVVSLRKPMLECSDRTVGVTQRKNGATKVTGVKLRQEGNNDTPDDSEEMFKNEDGKRHDKQRVAS